jgi:uncharacterized protein (TIGR02611 family)
MVRRRPVERLRERLVLGPVQAAVGDEEILRWGHVQGPQDGRHGLLGLTKRCAVVHWFSRDQRDVVVPWEVVTACDVRPGNPSGPVLTLRSDGGEVAVKLPVTTKARARKAAALLDLVAELATEAHSPALDAPGGYRVQAERRGLRGYTRRVGVSIAGVLLILLGVVFASPFLPGPGILTVLAGLALLATEYDWAREISHWMKGRVERFWEWRRERRRRRKAARAEPPER